MSEDSTANLAATVFTAPNAPSKSSALIPNCRINAILPSTVSFMSSKDGAKLLNAKALNAFSVSLALKPACANVEATEVKSLELTPNVVDRFVI